MPELPEVETIKKQLSSILPGLIIKDIRLNTPEIFSGNGRLAIGRKIIQLRRYGKMLVIDLSGGISLAIHLKMTGRLVFNDSKKKSKNNWDINYETNKHTHVVLIFTSGAKLYFNEVRKFGWLQILKTQDVTKVQYVVRLGPEFLGSLTLPLFVKTVKSSARPIKLVLMDQEKLAGVGNIYANESLWCAKIHPMKKANVLESDSIVTLFHCLEDILNQAIKWHGASDSDYRDAFGQEGQFQDYFKVYNREKQPCFRCRTLIRKIKLGGRGTYFCPKCQI